MKSNKAALYPSERIARRLYFRGKNLTIREWIKEIEKTDGIKLTIGCVQTRLTYEWPIEKILTTPPRKSCRKEEVRAFLANNKSKGDDVCPI